jgi:hypothetical protein
MGKFLYFRLRELFGSGPVKRIVMRSDENGNSA